MPVWAHDDPRFQRTLQKMRAMSPESKAIFNSAAAAESFAGKEAAKQLRLLQMGNDLRNRRRRFNINMDYKKGASHLRDRALSHTKRQAKFENILGALNVGATGLLSHMKNKQNLRQARRTNELFERLLSRRSN